jgi:anti-sigma factor RsiW
MNAERELKLQSYADGELPASDAAEVERWLAGDPEARALLEELRQTREALRAYEAEVRLPESREFYWSKIEREIRRLEAPERTRALASTGVWALLRRWAPLAGMAAAITLAVALWNWSRADRLAEVSAEFALADAEAFTYQDYANGVTLVWLPYPAEAEPANANTGETLN